MFIFCILISTITLIYFNDQLEIKRGEISSLDKKIINLLSEINAVSNEKKKKESELKKIEMNFRDLESKRNELESDLTESDYFLNMKNKEIDVLVSEKGDLIDSLKAKTKQIDIQSTNLKKIGKKF